MVWLLNNSRELKLKFKLKFKIKLKLNSTQK